MFFVFQNLYKTWFFNSLPLSFCSESRLLWVVIHFLNTFSTVSALLPCISIIQPYLVKWSTIVNSYLNPSETSLERKTVSAWYLSEGLYICALQQYFSWLHCSHFSHLSFNIEISIANKHAIPSVPGFNDLFIGRINFKMRTMFGMRIIDSFLGLPHSRYNFPVFNYCFLLGTIREFF